MSHANLTLKWWTDDGQEHSKDVPNLWSVANVMTWLEEYHPDATRFQLWVEDTPLMEKARGDHGWTELNPLPGTVPLRMGLVNPGVSDMTPRELLEAAQEAQEQHLYREESESASGCVVFTVAAVLAALFIFALALTLDGFL